MKNFTYENRIKLIFGADKIDEVVGEIKKYGSKVLIVIGGASFKRYGFYDSLTKQLSGQDIEHIEFSGQKRPLLSKVREGAAICRKERIDFILGIGGGTCMDMAKAIAFAAKQPEDVWKFLSGTLSEEGRKSLPVGLIVTYPSSGSEMDGSAQIDHDETDEHTGLAFIYPKFSWLNPEYVMTIDNKAFAYGQLTSFVQISSAYFSEEPSPLAEALSAGVLRMVLEQLQRSMNEPENIESRGSLMLASALNTSGLFSLGKDMGWWSLITLEGIMQTCCNLTY